MNYNTNCNLCVAVLAADLLYCGSTRLTCLSGAGSMIHIASWTFSSYQMLQHQEHLIIQSLARRLLPAALHVARSMMMTYPVVLHPVIGM